MGKQKCLGKNEGNGGRIKRMRGIYCEQWSKEMSQTIPFLELEMDCGEAAAWSAQRLNSAGLHTVRTFELQAAHVPQIGCNCPHHGTDRCDCQMVILLVYGESLQPASLIAHGHDGLTWISLVDTPQQRVDGHLEMMIRQALAPQS